MSSSALAPLVAGAGMSMAAGMPSSCAPYIITWCLWCHLHLTAVPPVVNKCDMLSGPNGKCSCYMHA